MRYYIIIQISRHTVLGSSSMIYLLVLLQVICRDLWALNLALLPDPPPAEPYHHAQESLSGRADVVKSQKIKEESQDDQYASDLGDDGSGGSGEDEANGSQDEHMENRKEKGYLSPDEDQDEDEDPELEALMRENSDVSELSDDNEEGEKLLVPNTAKKKKLNNGKSPYESLASTIAVLMLACWTMRIPVMYQDFTR